MRVPDTRAPQPHPAPLTLFIPTDSEGLLIHSDSIPIRALAISSRHPGVAWPTQAEPTPRALTDEHAVLVWVPSVLDNRNNVGPLLGQVNEVTARAV